jgi:two-component system, LytTR family, response regulator
MTKAVVVDDDAGNRQYLRTLLAHAAPDVEVAAEAANIADARTAIIAHAPELVFLDVEMPGGSGFDLLKQLGAWPFEVIFTTGFQRYAIQAIRFSALDYLLKPVQPDELKEALGRFRSRHPNNVARDEAQQQFIHNIAQDDERALKLTLTTGDRSYFVPPGDVMHCSADGNYTELHLHDGRRFVSARTLKEYEEMLEPWGFLRVHRSALVNRAAVAHVDDAHVVLKDGHRVEVSRRKREEVLRALRQ